MNYFTSYVSSTAIYQSYSQMVLALNEADEFNGPSINLSLLPNLNNNIKIIQLTKQLIDENQWNLFRFNPKKENNEFQLDSLKLKDKILQFLNKENELTLISNEDIKYQNEILIKNNQKLIQRESQFKKSLNQLFNTSNGPTITIIYGSDGGNAEKLAKKLQRNCKLRSLNSRAIQGNLLNWDELKLEEILIFIISTAGQGEFPLNFKKLWKQISLDNNNNNNNNNNKLPKFAIFGLGDSNYWPDDKLKVYYNKPSKDLFNKLTNLGLPNLVELGLGDDQDEEGYLTGYKLFENLLWESLNVSSLIVKEDNESIQLTDDQMKINSNYLRGTIEQGLEDRSTLALSEADTKLTKFHGIYQQDDRDLRQSRLERNLEPAYSFMVRVRVPGGVATPQQYLAMDKIASDLTGGSLKLTTRQAFQFHGVLKWNLKATIRGVNKVLMDTLAACGDVNRNVMLTVNPESNSIYKQIFEFSKDLSRHLTPKTSAYHEIWLQDKLVGGGDVLVDDFEPLYGPTYLPRKFKIAIAIPPSNDVDVYAHCLGYIAIIEKNEKGNSYLAGFNVTVGGGMGMTHNNKKTFPRLADLLGFCTVEQAIDVGEKVMLVQRDYGDRTNRKHARLKYTIEDRGIEWFRNEVENRLGYKLKKPKPFQFESNEDKYGWYQNPTTPDVFECGLFMQNGRIKDEVDLPWKTGLAKIAKKMIEIGGRFLLTPNQNLVISGIPKLYKEEISELLNLYKLNQQPKFTQLRLHSMACVALPTCSLAMAESERYLPNLIDKLDPIIYDLGLEDTPITMRMTGCPNGCARPYVAEIALVGKAPNIYNLYLGGGYHGQRLNKVYKESINEEQIIQSLKPLFEKYAKERILNENFGDFLIRSNIIKETTAGNNFHEV